MSEIRVGFPGYRGIVGSELMRRMLAENDFSAGIDPLFMSTSESVIGTESSVIEGESHIVADAADLSTLEELDVILTCQGSDYTKEIHPKLRASGWKGIWIDASSALRQEDSSILISDVVNRRQIDEALDSGIKDLVGPNCSSNILLMGAAGVFLSGAVERITFTTEQAISGAGTRELFKRLRQSDFLSAETLKKLNDHEAQRTLNPLQVMREATEYLRSLGQPFEANAIPSIGDVTDSGQTTEEKKAAEEINKILGNEGDNFITMDGNCVRIDSLRSHAISAHIELSRDIPLSEIEQMITGAHEFVKLIPNRTKDNAERLTPLAVSGTLDIAVGKVRKMTHGPKDLNLYAVGDQLLWGAAEPLRRALNIVKDRL